MEQGGGRSLDSGRKLRQGDGNVKWAINNVDSLPLQHPASVTKHLSDIHLTHALRLKQHCATLPLLRHRKAGIADLERKEDAEETLETGACAQKEKKSDRWVQIVIRGKFMYNTTSIEFE